MRNRVAGSNDRDASRRRHIFGFGAVIALALMLIGITLNAVHSAQLRKQAEAAHLHTLQILLVAEEFRAAANEAMRGERGYLLTGNAAFLPPYREASRNAPKLAAKLRELTQGNAVQRASIAGLEPQLKRYLGFIGRAVALADQGKGAEAIELVKAGMGRREIESLLAIVDNVTGEERRLLGERAIANARAASAAEIANYALAGVALMFLMIVTWAGIRASQARMITLDMEEQLRLAATTDELTGLLNRRAFLAALDGELARSARSGNPLAIALIDLDHFKSVNDRFGHAGGDEVLRKFADTARETMRASDLIGRLGGEEFAVLMPDTDQAQSSVASERLRDAVARRCVTLSSGALAPITISVGVAPSQLGEGRDRLIVRADEALYDAKESGRNQTRLAA